MRRYESRRQRGDGSCGRPLLTQGAGGPIPGVHVTPTLCGSFGSLARPIPKGTDGPCHRTKDRPPTRPLRARNVSDADHPRRPADPCVFDVMTSGSLASGSPNPAGGVRGRPLSHAMLARRDASWSRVGRPVGPSGTEGGPRRLPPGTTSPPRSPRRGRPMGRLFARTPALDRGPKRPESPPRPPERPFRAFWDCLTGWPWRRRRARARPRPPPCDRASRRRGPGRMPENRGEPRCRGCTEPVLAVASRGTSRRVPAVSTGGGGRSSSPRREAGDGAGPVGRRRRLRRLARADRPRAGQGGARPVRHPGAGEAPGRPQAGDQGAAGGQPVHRRSDDVQGQAGATSSGPGH